MLEVVKKLRELAMSELLKTAVKYNNKSHSTTMYVLANKEYKVKVTITEYK